MLSSEVMGMQTTSASLLGHLQQADDPAAWDRFVHIYSPLLYAWAGHMGLQHADALDLVQEVFTTLVQKLPEFTYDRDKGFRNWLFRVTRNKYLEKVRRRPLPVDSGMRPEKLAAPTEDVLEKADFQRYLLRQVLPAMRELFQPSTWQAFWEHVVEARPAPEVAARVGVTVNAVFKAKARVLARLHQELADLTPD
jgi:RNA polymerase sigma-70 factor, ECF subfamily